MLADFTITNRFSGVDFVESVHATSLDWSGCRSPSRAKRRHANGIPQRVRRVPAAYMINGVVHIHPEMARKMRDHLASQAQERAEKMILSNLRT